MGVGVGGVSPQVKLRLRKKNKNITLENIDKYNKNKLLKLFSDCYIVMQVLEVYPGEIDDEGEPVSTSQYMEWKNSHPDDIPDNFRNLLYDLVANNIYPKLCYLHNNGYENAPIISFLSNFYTTKFGRSKAISFEYISKNPFEINLILQRIQINLSPFGGYSYVKIHNIQSNVVKE